MSAHFDISKISFFGLDDWAVAVCAWRGCCLEVFARAEHSVADCLRALETSGIQLTRDARHAFASTRLKALTACIKSHPFGGHEKTALARIDQWERVYETRAFLAHGKIKATARGITITHITFDGKAENNFRSSRCRASKCWKRSLKWKRPKGTSINSLDTSRR